MSRFSSLVRLFVLVLILTLLTVTLNIQAAPDLTTGVALPVADTEAPISAVEALPEFSKEQVTVKWSGYDPGDSGIQAYDVQYRDVTASSAWADWQMGVVTTTASFTGTTGRTYAFRSRALDYAQNQEDWPAGDGDAHTTFYAWAITGTAHTNTGSPLAGVNVTTEPSAPGVFASDADGLYSAYVITPSDTYTVSWARPGYGSLPATTFREPAHPPIVYQGTLSAQGNIVTVGGLTVGQTYRIVVTGTYQYSIGGAAWADAQWSVASHCTTGVFCYYSRNVSFNGVLLAAKNGQDAADPNHEYTFLWTADAPQLQMYLSDSYYFDNSGSLAFEISPEDSTSLYQGELSAQGNVVTLSGLQVNRTYRIIIRGMFEFSIGGGSWADAQWTTWSCPSMVLCLYFGAVSFNGVQLAAQNGQDVVDPTHEYTFLWTADAPQLQMYILDSDYNDNSGHLTFEIFSYEPSNDPNVFLPPADDLIRNGHFEQGTGAINNWMVSGVSTPTVTIAARHTGRQSALLKAAPSLENGLVSYWKLDEATGNALDVLGTNPLTATNAPGSTVGMVQGARTFSGDHQYFSIPTRPSVEVGDTSFTFTAWVSMTDKANHRNFVGKQIEITETDRDYSLYYDINFDRFIFQVAGPDGVTLTRAMANSLGSPAANVWYFLAGGYDAASGYVWISVNGDLRETTPFTGNVHVGLAPFMLGAVDNPYYGYHSGWLDEVGFWKRALTLAEVAALYNNGQGLAYPFNTSTSGTAIAQAVTIPLTMTSPILSFLYQPGGISSLENGLTSHWKPALTPEETTTLYSRGRGLTYPFSTSAGELDIQVTDGVTTTTIFTTTFDTTDWTHQWLDLTAWKGQTITLTFTLHGTKDLPAQVYLDEVTLGSGYPDTWVQLANPSVARLGSTITYQLTYGNQAPIPAYDVQLTATLPAQVTFVAASLPPANMSNSLIWDLGDLAAQSGPHTILITAAVTSTITSINTLTNTVSISPAASEVERANNFYQTNLHLQYIYLLPLILAE